MPPTDQEVTEYVARHPGCKSKDIAKALGCKASDVNRARDGYAGVYKNPGVSTRDFRHYPAQGGDAPAPAASLKRKPDTALTTIEEERVTKRREAYQCLSCKKTDFYESTDYAQLPCEWCLPFTESDDPDDLLNRYACSWCGECFVKCEDGKRPGRSTKCGECDENCGWTVCGRKVTLVSRG